MPALGIVRTDLQFGVVTWHYSGVEIPGCWSAVFQPNRCCGSCLKCISAQNTPKRLPLFISLLNALKSTYAQCAYIVQMLIQKFPLQTSPRFVANIYYYLLFIGIASHPVTPTCSFECSQLFSIVQTHSRSGQSSKESVECQ